MSRSRRVRYTAPEVRAFVGRRLVEPGRARYAVRVQRSDRTARGDEALVDRLIAGDEAAFSELVARLHGRLLRFAATFVRERSAAEEVVQDTWIAVVEGLDGFERRASLEGWIFRIVANRARTRAVREARSVPLSSFEVDPLEAPADAGRFDGRGHWSSPPRRWDEDDPERLALRGELLAALQEAIDQLPPAQRAVIVLRDIEGLETDEICNILALSETNARVLLHRARTKLRAALEARLGR